MREGEERKEPICAEDELPLLPELDLLLRAGQRCRQQHPQGHSNCRERSLHVAGPPIARESTRKSLPWSSLWTRSDPAPADGLVGWGQLHRTRRVPPPRWTALP